MGPQVGVTAGRCVSPGFMEGEVGWVRIALFPSLRSLLVFLGVSRKARCGRVEGQCFLETSL